LSLAEDQGIAAPRPTIPISRTASSHQKSLIIHILVYIRARKKSKEMRKKVVTIPTNNGARVTLGGGALDGETAMAANI
jgi:hypothetical protein